MHANALPQSLPRCEAPLEAPAEQNMRAVLFNLQDRFAGFEERFSVQLIEAYKARVLHT